MANVALETTSTFPKPLPDPVALATTSVPLLTMIPPLNVFAPASVSAADPILIIPATPFDSPMLPLRTTAPFEAFIVKKSTGASV